MQDIVKDYYGKQLQSSDDLKTSACCDASAVPDRLKPLLSRIHPEVLARYFGCGFVCPPRLKGTRVLDLGCGAGRDAYLLAQLVGQNGEVIGIDMTDEQLAVAEAHLAHQAQAFGFANVSFRRGYIEHLEELGLEEASFDLVVSNCVVNLCPDKEAVLNGVHRLLKPGGEFYFSDVYADRRLPAELALDPVLYGECLGGALYWNDFLKIAAGAGFVDPRLVEDRRIHINDPEVAARVNNAGFHSATYRLFKLADLEGGCEDYGQAVIYRGTVPEQPHRFTLDKHHVIETGRVFPVCGNTWRMLHETRFSADFEFIGDFGYHFGLFERCGAAIPFGRDADPISPPACC